MTSDRVTQTLMVWPSKTEVMGAAMTCARLRGFGSGPDWIRRHVHRQPSQVAGSAAA